jgi:aspartate/methionine/tyrosine aminotransferase
MDFPSLEKAVTPRTRGVVVVHPNNPTGSYVQAHELSLLNAFCREHGAGKGLSGKAGSSKSASHKSGSSDGSLALIVDEVFLDYAHNGELRPTFAANRDALTFTLSGLSKVSALPQMKVAWIAVSGPPADTAPALARLEVIADTYLSMNAPLQWATPALLDQGKSLQKQLLGRVCGNLTELDRHLAAQKTCERLAVDGGWYAILRVPVTKSDEDLAIELLQKGSVLVHPGHFYDFPSDGYFVLSLITPATHFSDGIGRILELLNF